MNADVEEWWYTLISFNLCLAHWEKTNILDIKYAYLLHHGWLFYSDSIMIIIFYNFVDMIPIIPLSQEDGSPFWSSFSKDKLFIDFLFIFFWYSKVTVLDLVLLCFDFLGPCNIIYVSFCIHLVHHRIFFCKV